MYEHQRKVINETVTALEILANALRKHGQSPGDAEVAYEHIARQLEHLAKKLQRGTAE